MKEFIEKQRFSNWIIIGLVLLNVIMIYFLIMTIGTKAFRGLLFAGLLPSALILFLFSILNLTIMIDNEGIRFKFFPFHLRYIQLNWTSIVKCKVIDYEPIKEYGGWGIRFGRKGKAYTVKGKVGLNIQLKSGEMILIGTQKENEIKTLIDKYFNKQRFE